jgi:hypothetical protein
MRLMAAGASARVCLRGVAATKLSTFDRHRKAHVMNRSLSNHRVRMLKYCATVADRLLEMVVPRVSAGACPCGDSFCSTHVCFTDPVTGASKLWWRVFTNCNCQTVKIRCQCT